MKTIHDKLVFELDGEVILTRMERHIELNAPGFFARIDRPFTHSVVRVFSVMEQARYDSNVTQAVVRYGHDELVRFETLEEASFFVNRLQAEIRELMTDPVNNPNGAGLASRAVKVTSAMASRIFELLGVVATGGAIAFAGAVMVYPGWKYGEKFYGEITPHRAMSEEACVDQMNRTASTTGSSPTLTSEPHFLQRPLSSLPAGIENHIRELQMKIVTEWGEPTAKENGDK